MASCMNAFANRLPAKASSVPTAVFKASSEVRFCTTSSTKNTKKTAQTQTRGVEKHQANRDPDQRSPHTPAAPTVPFDSINIGQLIGNEHEHTQNDEASHVNQPSCAESIKK